MKIILYIATSLDGFIADENGEVDWLPQPDKNSLDLFGYNSLLNQISTIVMGRKSYQQIIGFGEWAWEDKQTYVFSANNLEIVDPSIQIFQGKPKEFVEKIIENKENQSIWLLGGARLVESFAAENLIDEVLLTIIPSKIKSGIKLHLPYENFRIIDSVDISDGIIQKKYIALK
ncbi:MAG: dihydrofolate reductase [Legionellales bacterium]|nr:dihydrofolate reductase [Legionellales bacterium]